MLKPDGKPLVDREEWRTNKTLGSLLCSTKDIFHRCYLGYAAFNNFKKVWMQGSKISLDRKLCVYEAQVVSTMLYNSNSWSAPKWVFEKLDVTHRRHLRSILNCKWPHAISNKSLYERCNSRPLSERVHESRWKMLGHVLRSQENSPSMLAFNFSIGGSNIYKARRGRHKTNLLSTLKQDLKSRNIKLNSLKDMYELRNIACDRVRWRKLF